jgi:hypothetical protein
MSDDLSNTGKRDDIRISGSQEHEIRYWSEKWGVSTSILKQAVSEAGPLVKNVESWLRENNHLKS